MNKLMIKTMLIAGLLFVFVTQGNSQVACRTAETLEKENASAAEKDKELDCWWQKFAKGDLNLSGAYLRGVRLSYLLPNQNCNAPAKVMDLSGRNFMRANLSRANLSCSNLLYANFNRANLSSAKLYGADLRGASFVNANLSDADLNTARSFGADFDKIVETGEGKIIRLRFKHAICTRSDDEGPDNDADLSFFGVEYGEHPYGGFTDLYKWKSATEADQITIAKDSKWVANEEQIVQLTSEPGMKGSVVRLAIRVFVIEADAGNFDGGGVGDETIRETEIVTVILNSDQKIQPFTISILNSDVGFELYFEAEVIKL